MPVIGKKLTCHCCNRQVHGDAEHICGRPSNFVPVCTIAFPDAAIHDALERFVWQTVHKRIYGRRPEWFEPLDRPHFVMWWVPAGHRPDVAEAKGRLEHLWAHGPSDYAFSWEDIPGARLWKNTRRNRPSEHAA